MVKLQTTLFAAALFASAGLQAASFKTGLWEFSTKVAGGGLPGIPAMSAEEAAQVAAAMKQLPAGLQLPEGMAMGNFDLGGGGLGFTATQCMSDSNGVPPTQTGTGGNDCQASNVRQQGNDLTWAVHCNSPDGVMDGEGRASYSGERMSGNMHLRGSSHGQAVDMTLNTTGRYLGACK